MFYSDYLKESSGSLEISYSDDFNFGWEVDRIAEAFPDKRALVWCNADGDERIFSFSEINAMANRIANILLGSGIGKGDRVVLILKRHYEYWAASVAIHKIGAVLIPMTHMLTAEDLAYRFSEAGPKAVIATHEEAVLENIMEAEALSGKNIRKWTVRKAYKDFRNLDEDMEAASDKLERIRTSVHDPMVIYFTSGTTGHPKGVIHDFSYPLAHIVTALKWQQTFDGGLHFTVAETGWAKASWGKIYGQWLTGCAVMVYDFDTFDPRQLASVINRYEVTSFCAPPTVYRYLAKKGIPALPTLRHATTAGEYLSPEIFRLFKEKTGLDLYEGYGQTETTLLTACFSEPITHGSMGKPSPLYDVRIARDDGSFADADEIGEIVILPKTGKRPIGIFIGYLNNEELYRNVWRGGVYHTGDTGWIDSTGSFWFHGRKDDVIKSGGFRIGPREIEDILITHPAVLECSVIGVPDPLRGQAIKAVIILDGKEPSKELEKDIRDYCNSRLAEYKWIRSIEFVEHMPKTISGKVRKTELRKQA